MKALVLFSGFGGVDIALKNLNINSTGIELESDIAAVAKNNGFNVITADVRHIDPKTLGKFDILHASPPCPNFSLAKTDAQESELDIELGKAIANYIRIIRPKIFTLENVFLYRKSISFSVIRDTLTECNYRLNWWHLNSANYGVPQSRKRLILIARKDGPRPLKPNATHTDHTQLIDTQLSLFPPLPAYNGWYTAVEDLIPSLPLAQLKPKTPCIHDPHGRECRQSLLCRGHFAPWQMERLPEKLMTFMMAGSGNTNFKDAYAGRGCVPIDRPSPTLTTTHPPTAFVVEGSNVSSSKLTIREAHQPICTLIASFDKTVIRTWLTNGRVVRFTPRAVARLQTFPDWYRLPEKRALAFRGVGNAVPPLWYEKIIESCL